MRSWRIGGCGVISALILLTGCQGNPQKSVAVEVFEDAALTAIESFTYDGYSCVASTATGLKVCIEYDWYAGWATEIGVLYTEQGRYRAGNSRENRSIKKLHKAIRADVERRGNAAVVLDIKKLFSPSGGEFSGAGAGCW